MKVLVTGGAGFIGSAVVRHLIQSGDGAVVFDKLTYAANLQNLAAVENHPAYAFIQADICDGAAVGTALAEHRPDAIMHLAAESHVDRSIDGPAAFVDTNIVGTYALLQAARAYYDGLTGEAREGFRFHHVSTDEVFGSLGGDGAFTADTPYDPRSPYSASKAASDHLAMAWHHTYGLPVVLSNCSNNYGPFQFPEKLIPLVILNALEGKPLPVYGKGANVRDWLYVEDHAAALATILKRGRPGATYLVGGDAERTNMEVVLGICRIMDDLAPLPGGADHQGLIEYVTDRPGHDLRYAIDFQATENELGWRPSVGFEAGLIKTVEWYLGNEDWWRPLRGRYDGGRLGLMEQSGKGAS